MITCRTAQQCGQADFGWLQARYTFSFGHYFDPKLMGYASLRVLNQEVLAPGASFQPRTYPSVDILNLILQGEAEYRDSDGNTARAKAGEALLLATQPSLSYSEQNVSNDTPLTRLQLWLDACPERNNERVQRLTLPAAGNLLLASPDGAQGSLQLRQQVWIHHLDLQPGEVIEKRMVRFRTLGCWPLTGAVESEAQTLPEIIEEMLVSTTSERQGRVIDRDQAGSMELKKRQGYF